MLKTHNPVPILSGQHSPLGSCQGMKYEGFYTGSCHISISCKFCFRKVEELYAKSQAQTPPILAKFLFFAFPHPFLPASLPPSLPASFTSPHHL